MNIKKLAIDKTKFLKVKKTIASALMTFSLSTSMGMVAQEYAAIAGLPATQSVSTRPLFKAEMLPEMLPNMIFSICIDGSFLQHIGNQVIIQKLLATGGIEDVRTIDLMQGETKEILESGKELFVAEFMAPGFLVFRFGIKEYKDFNSDSNHSSTHTDCITKYFDIAANTFFEISHPDFWNTYIEKSTTDPQKLNVNLYGIKDTSAETGQSKRVFFDLTTKTFGETMIDLCKFPAHIINNKYIYEKDKARNSVDIYKYQIVDKKIVREETLLCSISSPLHDYALNDESFLTYTKSNGQYLIPYMVDLNDEAPMEVPLLTPSEMRTLKLDVYDPQIIDGLLVYKTHGEERVFHYKPVDGLELGKKGLLAQKILEKYSSELCLLLSNNLYGKTPENIQGSLYSMYLDYKQYMHEVGLTEDNILASFSEIERTFLNLLEANKSIFIEIFNEVIFPKILKSQFAEVHHTSIETADPKFNQVLYYTKPEGSKSDGWFIIDVHGGPHARVFNELSTEQQFFSSRGYPYIVTNIRGSTGFGTRYEMASDKHWYDVMDDVQKVVEWARATGIGQHPIIMGTSFGGYAAAACFAKGISDVVIPINGIFDIELNEKKLSKTIHTESNAKKQYGETAEEKAQTSVTTHLTKRPGKMFIFCGLKDTICLPEQSRTLFDKMKELGNNVEMVSFEGEGHGFSIKKDIVKLRLIEEFLGNITGYQHEPNGYGLLATHPGIVYERSQS
ncbi:MAG: prolyl oligopeptidase family serine peptidase [Proteobacteria bacterium]|nr:prolyl oligopeptidase family serine peptidase [Pseudomonadota bacterium]